jgi:hypothetical protein
MEPVAEMTLLATQAGAPRTQQTRHQALSAERAVTG